MHLCSTCNAVPANSANLTLRYCSRSNSASSQSSKRKAPATSEDSDSSEDDELDLKDILRAVKKGSKKTDKLVSDLKTEVESFNTNLNKRCDGIDSKIDTLEGEIKLLKKSHAAEMDAMEEKVDALDFKTKTEIFIHGYANAGAAELNLTAAVTHLADHLDVKITERDIQKIRVVKRRPNQTSRTFANVVREKPPIIAVDFFSHETALRLTEAKKSYGKLTNQDLLEVPDTSPISVSFPLNREKYALLRETKTIAARYNIKYVWNSQGSIFIRETDGAKAIKVKNASHLDALLPPLYTTQPPPSATQMDISSPN